MNRDSQYLRHWAAMARLTEEQSSLLTADTLEALAGKFEALEAQNVALKDCVSKYAEAVEFWNSWADEEDRLEPMPQSTTAPVDMVSVQEAWEACGGNPGIKATRDELLEVLRIMDEAEHEAAPPVPVAHQVQQLRSALIDALAWIDAVPRDTVLPTMPGFDRDDVDNLVDETAPPAPEMPFTYAELKDMHGDKFARGYECGWKRRGESEDMRRSHKTTPATDNTEAQYESLKRGKTS